MPIKRRGCEYDVGSWVFPLEWRTGRPFAHAVACSLPAVQQCITTHLETVLLYAFLHLSHCQLSLCSTG